MEVVGMKLPRLEFKTQKVEALFANVRTNYFTLFRHYLYFDIAKWSYLQYTVIVPYIFIAPSIITGAITLGALQQTTGAFTRVEDSFRFLVRSWTTIVELMAIYKRLKGFQEQIDLALS